MAEPQPRVSSRLWIARAEAKRRGEGGNHALRPRRGLCIPWGCLPCLSHPPTACFAPTGFANILKILTKDSSREELLSFIQQFGSHYIAEALYGSEFSCTIHFPSKKVQQQLWLQYQKGEEGRALNAGPFYSYFPSVSPYPFFLPSPSVSQPRRRAPSPGCSGWVYGDGT